MYKQHTPLHTHNIHIVNFNEKFYPCFPGQCRRPISSDSIR